MPTSDDGFILFVGRLVRTKGLSYLIDAMKMVNSKLVICGSGPEEARLRRLIAANDLDDKVELRGRVDEQEKMRLMASCSVFVMPSTWESYGLAVVEAMALEKPIVASNVGGLPEVIGEGGFLVNPGDLLRSLALWPG